MVKKVTTTPGSVVNGAWVEGTPSVEITPAQNGITAVGNKQVTTEDIDFGTTYEADSTLEYKARKEIDGVKGKKTITTFYKVDPYTGLTDQKMGDPTVEITKAAQNKVIKIGNKQVIKNPDGSTTTKIYTVNSDGTLGDNPSETTTPADVNNEHGSGTGTGTGSSSGSDFGAGTGSGDSQNPNEHGAGTGSGESHESHESNSGSSSEVGSDSNSGADYNSESNSEQSSSSSSSSNGINPSGQQQKNNSANNAESKSNSGALNGVNSQNNSNSSNSSNESKRTNRAATNTLPQTGASVFASMLSTLGLSVASFVIKRRKQAKK